MMLSIRKSVTTATFVAVAIAAAANQTVNQVTEGGRTVSTQATVVNGQVMVPLSDVASYFGYTVQESNGSAILVKSGLASSGATSAPETFAAAGMNLVPAPPPPPVQLTAKLGSTVQLGPYTYAVTSVRAVGASYRERYDQRADTLHPQWSADKLVAVDMSVTNSGSVDVVPTPPAWGDVTVFDSGNVGYPASAVDQAQQSSVVTGLADYSGMAAGQSLVLAPGGVLRYTVLASVPKGASIKSIQFSVPGSSADPNGATGAETIVTVPAG